jgi:hypothetical protein
MNCVRYRFFNVPVEIGSETAEMAGQIGALYAEFEDRSEDAPLFRYVVACGQGAGGHVILRNGECVAEIPEGKSALLVLEDKVMEEVIAEVEGMFFIHAAVLSKGGVAVLLPGASGAGKSTLSLALASRGWAYLSDEIAPINEDDLRVRPFLRGIKLRPASFEFFPSLNARETTAHNERQYLRLRELPITLGDGSHEIKSVIFPKYRAGAEPRLSPIPKAMAASVLAKCSLSFQRGNGRTLLMIERLVKSVECLQFEVGEIWKSCEVLEEFHAGRKSLTISEMPCLMS